MSISWIFNVLCVEHQRSRSVDLRELPGVNLVDEVSILRHFMLESIFGQSELRLPFKDIFVVGADSA